MLFLRENISQPFIQFPFAGHVGGFQLFAITNGAAADTLAKATWGTGKEFLRGLPPEVKLSAGGVHAFLALLELPNRGLATSSR